ncbi:MAG: SpoIID/LytB domain-containing protein [Marmoricola sp.]
MSEPVVPVTSTFTVTGHGYGHGHGMSQYGARGAAIAGLTASQILAFYYPGTATGTDSRRIRVQITGDTGHDVVVLPERGLKITDLGTGRTYALPAKGQKAWRIRVAYGHVRLAYLLGGWHRYKPGGRGYLVGNGQFSSSTSALTLRTPSGDRRYRGYLRLDSGITVNVLALDNYLKGVVPREMPALWQAAAVQAQAIAARTYAARSMTDNNTRAAQVCDTSSCQVYGGLAAEQPASNAAVAATAGKILTYGGIPAFTQFGSSNGGWTSAGNAPYLPAKADPYDATPSNPNSTWTKTINRSAVRAAYPGHGALTSIQVGARDAAGKRVTQILLTWSDGAVTKPSGDSFRSIFGLKSTYFSVSAP